METLVNTKNEVLECLKHLKPTLLYQGEGMPSPVALKKIAEDYFEIVIPPGAQVRGAIDGKFPTFRFNRDASGETESLSVVNPDGDIQATFSKSSQFFGK